MFIFIIGGFTLISGIKARDGHKPVVSLGLYNVYKGVMLNKGMIKDFDYTSFGKLTVISEQKYFKGSICKCWCECGRFINVDKERLESGEVVNCGNIKHKNNNIHKSKTIKKPKYSIKISTRYGILKNNCKKTKHKLLLSLEDYTEIAQITECHYCGAFVDWFNKSSAYYLDRKDNNVGYTKENCVVCCTRCNMAKGNRFTYDEWLKIGEVIKSWVKTD